MLKALSGEHERSQERCVLKFKQKSNKKKFNNCRTKSEKNVEKP